MRILHAQKLHGIAGSEKYLLEILPEQARNGHDVGFIALRDPAFDDANAPLYECFADANIRIFRVDLRPAAAPLVVPRLVSLLRCFQPDVLHSHLVHADFLCALAHSAWPSQRALVSTKHGYSQPYTNAHGFEPGKGSKDLFFWLERFSESRVTRSFAISDGLHRLFTEGGISRSAHMDRIHYGFTFPAAAEVEPEFRLADQQLVLVGRLVAMKGHRFAFEAVKRLVKRWPKLQLVLVGSGEEENQLKRYVSELGISDNIVFMGYNPKARAIMRASDVVLVPSVAEGFGVVFLEAFSCERPVVAFDVPASNELIIDGETGLLAPPFDVDAYASAIDKLLADPPLGERLAHGARERLLGYFSRERMTRDTLAFYEASVRQLQIPS